MAGKPAIRAFFDDDTNTFSYLVADPETKRAAVIDPVLDYDPEIWRGGPPLGRGRARGRAGGRIDHRVVSRDPRSRRPLVRIALR